MAQRGLPMSTGLAFEHTETNALEVTGATLTVALLVYFIAVPLVFAAGLGLRTSEELLFVAALWLVSSPWHLPVLIWLVLPLGWLAQLGWQRLRSSTTGSPAKSVSPPSETQSRKPAALPPK